MSSALSCPLCLFSPAAAAGWVCTKTVPFPRIQQVWVETVLTLGGLGAGQDEIQTMRLVFLPESSP